MPTQTGMGLEVLASMATPAVLLLANAMFILSTNQRLQSILQRVTETEASIAAGADPVARLNPDLLRRLLSSHARRARTAHRALLCFYGSAAAFIAVVVLVGLSALSVGATPTAALVVAFVGCGSLICGAGLLILETWSGIHATDERFAALIDLCQRANSETG